MRRIFIPMLFGFGTMLALVIGSSMTVDSMAVVLGVAVGVAASVPVSILLVALVQRSQRAPQRGQIIMSKPETYTIMIPPPTEPRQVPARRQP